MKRSQSNTLKFFFMMSIALSASAKKCSNETSTESNNPPPGQPYADLNSTAGSGQTNPLDTEAARRSASEDRTEPVPKTLGDDQLSPNTMKINLSATQLATYHELQDKLSDIDIKIKKLKEQERRDRLSLRSESLHVELRRLEVSPASEWPEREDKIRQNVEDLSRSLL